MRYSGSSPPGSCLITSKTPPGTNPTNRTESVEFLSILLENQVFAEVHPPAEGCDESRKHQRKCVSICSVCWRDRKRDRPRNDYCAGVLVCEGRRSVEPIAAVTAPQEVAAQHQRLLHFIANSSAPTPCAQLNRYAPSSADGCDRKAAPKMPLLRT